MASSLIRGIGILVPLDLPGTIRSAHRQPLTRHRLAVNAAMLAGGIALFAAAEAEASRRRVRSDEEAVFKRLNTLPDRLHAPAWAVMQSGSLASVGVLSAGALLARRPLTGLGLGASGATVWGGAKLIKRRVGRGRPAAHIEPVTIRGREQTGLGFPSGHSAVAFALATVAAPALSPGWRRLAWSTAGICAGARMYVGAHLPLDIVGGIGLGISTGALTNLALGDRSPTRRA